MVFFRTNIFKQPNRLSDRADKFEPIQNKHTNKKMVKFNALDYCKIKRICSMCSEYSQKLSVFSLNRLIFHVQFTCSLPIFLDCFILVFRRCDRDGFALDSTLCWVKIEFQSKTLSHCELCVSASCVSFHFIQ